MTLLRRLGYASVAIAFLHIVFGAIVRITGSGMGCGDHWPTCYGYWIPPFSRMDLVIEVSHRYLALLLLVAVAALALVAWRRRAEPGVGGRGGVLRATGLALLLWIAPALLGALTVFLGNPPSATVAHKALAAALLAVLAVATVRAGGFGARALAGTESTAKARRGATIAAAMAIVVVLLGALTAKLPGAAVACAGFPLCSETSGPPGLAHVQLTHRVLAYLLAFHLLGLAIAFARRREPRPLVLASRVGVGLVVLQVALAGHMVLGGFPAAVRSAHQATGMAIWLTTFVMAYLAGYGFGRAVERAAPEAPAPGGRSPVLAEEPGPVVATRSAAPASATEPATAPASARADATAAAERELEIVAEAALVAEVMAVAAREADAPASAPAPAPPSPTTTVVAVEAVEAVDAVEAVEVAHTIDSAPAVEDEERNEEPDELSELDLELAAEMARRAEAREQEEEEREEWERAIAHEMAKLDAPLEEIVALEAAAAEATESTEELAASAAALAEELVVSDTPAFAAALEQAVEAAAAPAEAAPARAESDAAAAVPASPEGAAEESPPAADAADGTAPAEPGAAPAARKPRRLSMAVIVARGADF